MSQEIDWETVKANLDKLTSEALVEIARIIRYELSRRKSIDGGYFLSNFLWDDI